MFKSRIQGLDSSEADAEASRAHLEALYSKDFNADPSQEPPYPGTYSFHISYNPLVDLTATADLYKNFEYTWKRWVMRANPDVQELEGSVLHRILRAYNKNLMLVRSRELPDSLAEQRFRKILETIKLTKGMNRALIWVARVLPACERSLQQIGVATTAEWLSDQFSPFYQTGTDDNFINLRRRLGGIRILKANVTNGPRSFLSSISEATNHDFVGEYMLRRHQSFANINAQLLRIAGLAPFPEPFPPPTNCVRSSSDSSDDLLRFR